MLPPSLSNKRAAGDRPPTARIHQANKRAVGTGAATALVYINSGNGRTTTGIDKTDAGRHNANQRLAVGHALLPPSVRWVTF